MAKRKIFIASSGRTLNIAKAIKKHLETKEIDADVWSEVSKKKVGKSILNMLQDATKEYDFAVIILAKDDVMIEETGEESRKPRDNCVFEAGLFMGVLGAERCFLVTSLSEDQKDQLPSDLSGLIYISFTEPEDLTNIDSVSEQLKTVNEIITYNVEHARPLSHRPLSQQELLEREKREDMGGELRMDQVVVAAIQPLDLDYLGASQVRENIDNGNIRYVYFFQGNRDGAEKTCQLLQVVLLANLLESQSDADNWPGRLEKLKTNSVDILTELEFICEQERIKIFFFPEQPPSVLQYCIHNASDRDKAKLYLKREDEYFEWLSGREAYEFWDEVRQERGALYPDPAQALIYGVPGFSVIDGPFFKILERQIASHFPTIAERVTELCMKGPG